MDPTDPKNVTIDEIEFRPIDSRPARRRGDTATVEILADDVSPVATYRLIKRYEEYAGEADFGQLLGGRPYVREHPLNEWPVDSHIVPVVYGSDLRDEQSFWGVITGLNDDSRTIEETQTGGDSYGTKPYGIEPYGEAFEKTSNTYRLSIDIVKLADIDEYADRDELLEDLSPTVNQL